MKNYRLDKAAVKLADIILGKTMLEKTFVYVLEVLFTQWDFKKTGKKIVRR